MRPPSIFSSIYDFQMTLRVDGFFSISHSQIPLEMLLALLSDWLHTILIVKVNTTQDSTSKHLRYFINIAWTKYANMKLKITVIHSA